MSVSALNGLVNSYRADGVITLEEAENIISPADPTFGSPKAIGSFTGKDEFEIVKKVAADIKSGALVGEPGAVDTLDEFVAKGPDSRFKHILKGGSIGSAMRRLGAFLGGTVGGLGAFFAGGGAAIVAIQAAAVSGAAAFFLGAGSFLAVASAVVLGAAAIGLGAGHVVGMIQGTFDD